MIELYLDEDFIVKDFFVYYYNEETKELYLLEVYIEDKEITRSNVLTYKKE